jgi:hypothetical protein
MTDWGPRHFLAEQRLRNVLAAHIAATARILEQKISDAGPFNQRIDPHVLTETRNSLIHKGTIMTLQQSGVPWYYLARTDPEKVKQRIFELDAIHRKTKKQQFTTLIGQTLEIAVFRALQTQSQLNFFGHFPDLDAHDDTTPYSKHEPPSFLSGRLIPSGKQLDFLIQHHDAGYAGIEVKNIREWIYPDRDEVRELLFKCCALDIVPILIARRIQYASFSVLNPCGVLIHQTYNQLYPASAAALAEKVRDKSLLGYHDVRLGNFPDKRLLHFIHDNLPRLLPTARQRFDTFKDLLSGYGNGEHSYKSFASRVKRRMRGESEDLLDFGEPDLDSDLELDTDWPEE